MSSSLALLCFKLFLFLFPLGWRGGGCSYPVRQNWRESEENLKDAFKYHPLSLYSVFKLFSFSFPKGDVVEDVPTLSARIEENQKFI